MEQPGELREGAIPRRAHLIHQFPHVARHIERSIRAGAVGKIGNRQQLATAYVGTRRVRVIAPGEEKALFAALRLFPFAALGQTLACPFSESARIQMWIIETTADIIVL